MSFHRNIRLLTWFNFFTDFKLYAPIAIIYFSHIAHSYALGASIFSIVYITSALFDIPTGIISDHLGRKKTIVLGAIFAVVSVTFYALGTNYAVLVCGALSEGLSRAFYSGNNNALIHNLLAEEGLAHEYHIYSGKLTAMFQIAGGISALVGGVLASWSFYVVMWLSVLPQVICLIISFMIIDSRKPRETIGNVWEHLIIAGREFFHNGNLRLLGISSILDFGMGETIFQFQTAFYQTVWPVWALGIARSLSNGAAAAGFFFSGKIINRFNSFKILLLDDIYTRIADVAGLVYPSLFSPLLMSSTSFFYGLGSTAEGSLLQKEFTDKQRATMSSLTTFAGSLFFGLFTFFIGLLADRFGPRTALLIIPFFQLSVVYLHWKLFNKNQKLGK